MLIVVTGSRTWPAARNGVISAALDACATAARKQGELLKVRVGDARGVDKFTYQWCELDHRQQRSVDKPRQYEARWRDPCIDRRCKPGHRRSFPSGDICPLQGYVRNEKMVDDLPTVDLLLAFIHNNSRGATQCYEYAKSKGIETQDFRL